MQCHRTLGRFFTWRLAVLDGHQLVTAGPYSVVRHPSYSGFLLILAGQGLMTFSRGSYFVASGLSDSVVGRAVALVTMGWLAFVSANMVGRVRTEDDVLRKEFGTQWDEWAKRTPYRLVPYVY